MNAYYALPATTDTSNVPASDILRATALGAEPIIGDPSGLVTVYPSVVVMSDSLATQVLPDNTGQVTLAQVQAAQTNATNAEGAKATNKANALASLKSAVANLGPDTTQAQADLNTLSTSTDPHAPIMMRIINDALTMGNAVANLLVALEIIG